MINDKLKNNTHVPVTRKAQLSISEDMDGVNSQAASQDAGSKAKKPSGVSRRKVIGGAAAAVIVGAGGAIAVPLLSNAAETDPASKDDVAALEYELSMLTRSSSDAELTSHKSETIDENSDDIQYPSSKAVYEALGNKVDMVQGTEYAGFIFVVGDDGKLKLSKFTTDELNEESTLPVENRVIYKQIKDIVRALSDLDAVPVKDSARGVESGGVYKTYQETVEITDLSDIKMGVNYKYTGKSINGTEGTYSIRRIDNVLLALSQDDPSVTYTSIDNGISWAAPYGGW